MRSSKAGQRAGTELEQATSGLGRNRAVILVGMVQNEEKFPRKVLTWSCGQWEDTGPASRPALGDS